MSHLPYMFECSDFDWRTKNLKVFDKTGLDAELLNVLGFEKKRPLGVISDFAAEGIKQDGLDSNISSVVISEVLDVISKHANDFSSSRGKYLHSLVNPDLALLDLLYIKTLLKKKYNRTDVALEYLIDNIALYNNRIPWLTYEDLIVVNPLDSDPRTFFKGKLGWV